jgi:DNA-binding transcriptional ArsR family regulator
MQEVREHDPLAKLLSLKPLQEYPDIDIIRMINVKSFETALNNETRYAIASLIALGTTTASELATKLGIPKTGIYRHLHILRRAGIIEYKNGKFYIASRLFLVYDVNIDENGNIRLHVLPDLGGFIDESTGFVVVRGQHCKCAVCTKKEWCLNAVKNIAKKLDVKIRSEEPLSAFREIVEELIKRDVVKILKASYLVVKVSEEIPEEVML